MTLTYDAPRLRFSRTLREALDMHEALTVLIDATPDGSVRREELALQRLRLRNEGAVHWQNDRWFQAVV